MKFKNFGKMLISAVLVLGTIVSFSAVQAFAMPSGDGTKYIKCADFTKEKYDVIKVPLAILCDEELRASYNNKGGNAQMQADIQGYINEVGAYFAKHFGVEFYVDKWFLTWGTSTGSVDVSRTDMGSALSSSLLPLALHLEIMGDYKVTAYYKDRVKAKTAGKEIAIAFSGQDFWLNSGGRGQACGTTIAKTSVTSDMLKEGFIKTSSIAIYMNEIFKEPIDLDVKTVLQHELGHAFDATEGEHYIDNPNRICVMNNDPDCFNIFCINCYDTIVKNRTLYK